MFVIVPNAEKLSGNGIFNESEVIQLDLVFQLLLKALSELPLIMEKLFLLHQSEDFDCPQFSEFERCLLRLSEYAFQIRCSHADLVDALPQTATDQTTISVDVERRLFSDFQAEIAKHLQLHFRGGAEASWKRMEDGGVVKKEKIIQKIENIEEETDKIYTDIFKAREEFKIVYRSLINE